MNEEEKAIQEYKLYEFLRRASLDDSILKRSRAAISVARSHLYGKLHGAPGTGQMLDVFIREL